MAAAHPPKELDPEMMMAEQCESKAMSSSALSSVPGF